MYCRTALIAETLLILYALTLRINRSMNGQVQRMPVYETFARTRHNVERAVDSQRNNRKLQFIGKHEGTTFE